MTPARRLGEVMEGVELVRMPHGELQGLMPGKMNRKPFNMYGCWYYDPDEKCDVIDGVIVCECGQKSTPVFATSAERDRWRERVGGEE